MSPLGTVLFVTKKGQREPSPMASSEFDTVDYTTALCPLPASGKEAVVFFVRADARHLDVGR